MQISLMLIIQAEMEEGLEKIYVKAGPSESNSQAESNDFTQQK
jgi:hypothetical protein